MEAVILAAGEGLRMWPMTQVLPKCLLPVPGGIPCARSIANALISNHCAVSIVVNSNHTDIYSHEFRDTDVKVITSRYKGTSGSLLSAEEFLNSEPFLIVYGDIYGFTEFEQLVGNYAPIATIAVTQSYYMPYGVAHIEKNKVLKFEEKPMMPSWWIGKGLSLWLGAAVVALEIFKLCRPGEDIAIDILPLLAQTGQLNAYVSSIPCQDVGEWEHYKRLFKGVKL